MNYESILNRLLENKQINYEEKWNFSNTKQSLFEYKTFYERSFYNYQISSEERLNLTDVASSIKYGYLYVLAQLYCLIKNGENDFHVQKEIMKKADDMLKSIWNFENTKFIDKNYNKCLYCEHCIEKISDKGIKKYFCKSIQDKKEGKITNIKKAFCKRKNCNFHNEKEKDLFDFFPELKKGDWWY